MTDAIVVEGLVKRFGATTALDGVDLTVVEGSVLGLLGPNGAGKTTVVRILTTLLAADAGRAEVAGLDVVRDADEVRAAIGLTGQYAAVDEYLTGFENLEMVGRLYRLPKSEARSRAGELLERFDLVDAAHRPAKTYSGGMRRRLDIAASLINRPRVLFLDEPTTGLDPRSRLAMWEFIAELADGGTTILLTTQYLEEADRLADRMVVIDRGQVIARGTADELKAQVGGERLEFTVTDAAALPGMIEALRPLGVDEPNVDVASRRFSMPVSGGADVLAEALRRLDGGTSQIFDIGLRRPDLDDVFLALTGHAAEDVTTDAGRAGRAGRDRRSPMSSLAATLSDSAVITKRNLIKVKRVPDLIVFATLSPIMFVLLFRYVFGGAINLPPGINYAEFLLPGIFAQTVVFGSTVTGASIAEDLQKGLIDRFRSLPMSRAAVLIGRTVADAGLNVISITVMALTGLAVGWRINSSVIEAIGGFLVLLVFAYAISWLMALVGLLVRTPEVVNNASFMVIFPLTFASNAFVPLESFPSVLRVFAEWNPVSTVVQAARELFGNTVPGAPVPDAWPLQHPALYTLLWTAIILAVFVPLSVRTYRRTAAR